MTAEELCTQVLGAYDAWLPWTGTYSQELSMRIWWFESHNQAMARCPYRFSLDEGGVPCSLLAQVMPDGEHRCPQHALYWRLEQAAG